MITLEDALRIARDNHSVLTIILGHEHIALKPERLLAFARQVEAETISALVHPAPATAETSGAMGDPLGYWICPNCKEVIGAAHISQERHTRCGHPVHWFGGKRLIAAPAAAPDGGQKCGTCNGWEVVGAIDDCPDCTPAREAKCVCSLSGRPEKYPVCSHGFTQDPEVNFELCENPAPGRPGCGHLRACHALGNTAGDGKEDGR